MEKFTSSSRMAQPILRPVTLSLVAIIFLLFFSAIPVPAQPSSSKLAALYRHPWGTRIDRVDLSGEGLTEVPCLSMYDIRQLDLSHNEIRNIAWRNLPTKVENINLSHNLLADTLVWDEFFTPEIHNLDLSHNRLKLFVPFFRFMDTLNLANNDLQYYVEFTYYSICSPDLIDFADLRNNPHLSTIIPNHHNTWPETKFLYQNTPWEQTSPMRDKKLGYEFAEKFHFTQRRSNAL